MLCSVGVGNSVARLRYIGDVFMASDSEPAFIVDVRLRRTHIHLARYCSPGKNCHLARSEWIKLMKLIYKIAQSGNTGRYKAHVEKSLGDVFV